MYHVINQMLKESVYCFMVLDLNIAKGHRNIKFYEFIRYDID